MGQITISVDLNNRAERAALVAFVNAIDAIENTTKGTDEPAMTESEIPAQQAAAEPVTAKPKKKAEPKAETQEAAPEPPQTEEAKPEEPKEQPTGVTELELRRAVSEAVQRSAENRNKIKSEFERIGIPNLSALSPDNYEEFLAFLKGLA